MFIAHCLVRNVEIEVVDEERNIGVRKKVEEHVTFFCKESSHAEIITLIARYQNHMKKKYGDSYSIQPLSVSDLGMALAPSTMLKLNVVELSRDILINMGKTNAADASSNTNLNESLPKIVGENKQSE